MPSKTFVSIMKHPISIALSLVLAVVICLLTLTPISVQGAPGSDKLYHLLAFGALAFPLAFGSPRNAVWVAILAIGYGALIEVIQPYVGRSAEWGDLLADAIGACLGAFAGWSVARLTTFVRKAIS